MSAPALPVPSSSPLRPWEGTGLLVLRNYVTYKRQWKLFVTGFLEPVFYLFSIGIGVGKLIHAFELNGHAIPYAEFVAPGMLAASAFNGALMDSTFNVFFKLKYEKLYDQMLATPLTTSDIARGEIIWGQLRGASYSVAFLAVMWAMGLVHSWWAVLAFPATLLIGFAFAAVGMAATSFMKTWQDFDLIQLVILPMFLFSGTFFPLDSLPEGLRIVVQLTPLYQGVDLLRGLTVGVIGPETVVHVAYLLVMGLVGLSIVSRRLDKLLLK